jgi:Xaa-Pro aminopeptidase
MEKRVKRVQRRIEEEKVDIYLTPHLPHIRYLVGFSGSNGLLLVKSDKVYFLTDFRYKEQCKKEIPDFVEVKIVKDLYEEASKLLSSEKRIGFDADHIVYSTFEKLRKNVGDRELVPIKDFIGIFRSEKEFDEIERIKRAQSIVDNVFGQVLNLCEPCKMTERELAAEIDYRVKKLGADSPAFPTIVASGPHSALPHAKPRDEMIGVNTMLLLDFGAVFEGYACDMTRTIWIGQIPDSKFKEMYNIVLDALEKAEGEARPGMTCKELDRIARDVIERAGYGEYFGHGLGHGVGIEVHEGPRIAQKIEDTLKPNMVFTLEPGIYLPDFGGVRIEDIVVMGEKGVEVITRASKEMISI